MPIIPLILLACSIFASEEQLPTIELEAQPNEIEVGDFVKLTWSVTNAKSIFISRRGKVTSNGMQSIRLHETTSFTLIAENEIGIVLKAVTVKVRGSRGDSDLPDRKSFIYPKFYKAPTSSWINFLDRVHIILQDSMGFTVNENMDRWDERFIFITRPLQKDYLAKEQDKQRIAAWRIAYLVEIEKPKAQSKEFSYFISAIIEYRRKIEQKWRLEEDQLLYNLGIQELNKAMKQVSQ